MNEVRQFIRYVIPGLLFFVELFLYILITDFSSAKEIWKFFSNYGGGINLLLLSAGVGFLFSIIHHTLYWKLYTHISFLSVNHKEMIKNAWEHKLIKIYLRNCFNEIHPDNISKKGAWRIVAYFWHTRKVISERIKGADGRTESISNLMHCIGTTLIGAIFIILIILIEKKEINLIIIFSIIIIHLLSYIITVKHAQGVTNMIIFSEFIQEKNENSLKNNNKEKPIEIYISKLELEFKCRCDPQFIKYY